MKLTFYIVNVQCIKWLSVALQTSVMMNDEFNIKGNWWQQNLKERKVMLTHSYSTNGIWLLRPLVLWQTNTWMTITLFPTLGWSYNQIFLFNCNGHSVPSDSISGLFHHHHHCRHKTLWSVNIFRLLSLHYYDSKQVMHLNVTKLLSDKIPDNSE